MEMSKRQTIESFWSRVDVRSLDECWPWLGVRNSLGYGSVSWHGITYVAHRIAAWTLGLIDDPACPADRSDWGFVLHECDTPPCCNPTHFEVGTLGKNQMDAYARGLRKPLRGGVDHPNAKLGPDQVRHIQAKYALGDIRQVDLATENGVSQRVISLVVRRESYQWIS